jgi:hypothetical protein
MMNTGKIVTLAAAFALAAGLASDADSKNISYEKMRKAGVRIPISNAHLLGDGKLQFDVYAKNISKFDYIWSKLWGKNFAYYVEGTSDNKDRVCPYFEKKDKTFFRAEEIKPMSHYRFTLGLPKPMMDEVIAAKCAISPEPDDDAAPEAHDDQSSNYLPSPHRS